MSHRHLKEELTCPICMELFRQPRRLPCGHSYCQICLKAILERCLDDNGLYLHYSRPLVCPECREEVNLDYGSGVEVIPPDFKLSKLVDLFKFMKKDDSSDSSGDELPPYQPHPGFMTSYPSGNSLATVTSASVSATSVPAILLSQLTNLSSSPVSQPLAAAGSPSPTRLQIATTLVADSSTQPHSTISAIDLPQIPTLVTSLCTHSQIFTSDLRPTSQPHISVANPPTHPLISTTLSQPHDTYASVPLVCTNRIATPLNLHVEAYNEQLSSESSAVVLVDSASTSTPASENPFIVEHHNDHSATINVRHMDVIDNFCPDITSNISVINRANHTTTGDSFSNLLPSGTTSEAARSTYKQADYQSQSASTDNWLLPELNASLNARDADAGVDRDRYDDHTDSHSYSELGAVGGAASNGRNKNDSFGKTELNVDSSEILSNWVNENHFYSQSCHNVSQFSPLMPNVEVQSCHENSPHYSFSGQTTRARSVPADTRELKRSEEDTQLTERVAVKSHHNAKARRVRNGIFSIFVDSDSSSDSSGSDLRVSRKSEGKPKRWLMTRFLRSVILSESSSTDYSDEDDDGGGEGGCAALRNKTMSSLKTTEKTGTCSSSASSLIPYNLRTDQIHSSQEDSTKDISTQKSETNPKHGTNTIPGHHVTVNNQSPSELLGLSQNESERQYFSNSNTRKITRSEVFSPSPYNIDSTTSLKEITSYSGSRQSIDSTTSPKEMTSQNASSHSLDSTIPKVVHGRQLSTEISDDAQTVEATARNKSSVPASIPQISNHDFPRMHYKQTARRRVEHPTSSLPNVGSPPTFYDNVNVSGSEKHIFHNLPNVGSPPTFYDNVNITTCKTDCSDLPNIGSPPTFYDNVQGNGNLEQARYNTACYGGLDGNLEQARYNTACYGGLEVLEGSEPIFGQGSSLNSFNESRFDPSNHQQSSVNISGCGPNEAQTLYENLNNGHNRPMQISSRLNQNFNRIRNPITDIEELKTGYEDIGLQACHDDVSKDFSAVSGRTDRHMGELDDNSMLLPPSSKNLQIGSVQKLPSDPFTKFSNSVSASVDCTPVNQAVASGGGHPSLYDNISNSMYNDHPQFPTLALSNQANAEGSRERSKGISSNKTEQFAQRLGKLNSRVTTEEHHCGLHMADSADHSSMDSQYTDNYFDQYSQHFRKGCASDQNSVTPRTAAREDGVCQRSGSIAEATISSVENICSKDTTNVLNSTISRITKDDANQRVRTAENINETLTPALSNCNMTARDAMTNASATNNSAKSLSNSGNSEADPASGASMPACKKPPQSRLKKFFTSLLSLSSSSDDENDSKSSSSDSSDW